MAESSSLTPQTQSFGSQSARTAELEDNANALSFSKLCETLDRIQHQRVSKDEKLRMLMSKELKQALQGQSPYPVMRLILPQLDNERQVYGLKQTSVAKMYVKLLGLDPKTSRDARALINWKDPSKQERASAMAGELGAVLEDVLKVRVSTRPSGATVGEANEALNNLAAAPMKDKEAALRRILDRFSASEQKWLMRIVFRDLKVGLRHESVLAYFHPDANERYNTCCNLRQVCAEFASGASTTEATGIQPFQPFAPMRAKGLKQQLTQIEPAMQGHPFIMEIKLDGERMICHKQGDRIMWISRNTNDYSVKYGPALDKYVLQSVRADTCILDGEMCAWSDTDKRFIPFGSNRTVATEELEIAQPTRWLMFVVFDVLYLAGEGAEEMLNRHVPHTSLSQHAAATPGPIVNLPLRVRKSILRDIVREIPHRIEFVHSRTVTATDPSTRRQQIMDYFDQVVNAGEEGLVIKDLLSTYSLGEKSRSKMAWVKMKPEYSDMTANLDLILLGGYYGEGTRRAGDISHFLLGVKEPHREGEMPTKFFTFAKVGSGYTVDELHALRERLSPYWVRWDPSGAVPPHFYHWRYRAQDRPDVWIPPEKSVILEIKCAQLTQTDVFAAGVTCRFPRCEHIRYDKPWYECMDMRDIRDLLDGVRAAPAPGAAPGRERRKKAARKIQRDRGGGVAEQFKVFQSSDAIQEGNIFEGIEFCVMPSSRYRKQDIEELIVRNGGYCVGAPAVKDGLGTVIIAGNETFQVKNHIASGRYDVLDVSFILESVERGEQVAMAPHYFIFMTDATARELRKTTDVFGDHLWEDTDAQTLKRVFDEIDRRASSVTSPAKRTRGAAGAATAGATAAAGEDGAEEVDEEIRAVRGKCWRELAADLDAEELDALAGPYNCFWQPRCVVYLDMFADLGPATPTPFSARQRHRIPFHALLPLEPVVLSHGGELAGSLSTDVTHVIVHPDDRSRVGEIRARLKQLRSDPSCHHEKRVVDPSWVHACVEAGHVVEPTRDMIVKLV